MSILYFLIPLALLLLGLAVWAFFWAVGISGLFAVNASIASMRTQFPKAVAYNLGRVLTYAFLGVSVAVIGKTAVGSIPKLAAPVRLASGLLIISLRGVGRSIPCPQEQKFLQMVRI